MTAQIEGRRPVLEALRAGREISEIMITGAARPNPVLEEIRDLASRRGVSVRTVAREEIDDRAQTRAPQGVIAVASGFQYVELDDLIASSERLLLVALDGVTDPQNVGAIARSAEAAGAHGLILPARRSASIGPIAEKAAAGALEHLPVAQVTNLQRALDLLRERGLWIVALDAGSSETVYDLPVADEPICLVIGGEGKGVSRLVRERADQRVRIPMSGKIDSLNASAAAAVALFEIARKRS